MKKKILIFTATYNESENIINFLNTINLLNINIDLLIVDDNSPDKTSEVIENYNSKNVKINLLKREKKLGLDSAHKLAYTYAVTNEYDYLITMDADMSHDPKEIPLFIKYLDKYKFIIGSRYIAGGACNMKGSRLFLSFFGNKFIKYILRINCHEFTTSYRAFNLRALENFDLSFVKSAGYSFFMETIYQLHKRHVIIKEIPIIFLDRKYGKSKIPKVELFRTLFNVFKIKFLS